MTASYAKSEENRKKDKFPLNTDKQTIIYIVKKKKKINRTNPEREKCYINIVLTACIF